MKSLAWVVAIAGAVQVTVEPLAEHAELEKPAL